MRRTITHRVLLAALGVLALVGAACSAKANAGSATGSHSLQITSPATGAKVAEPFTITVKSDVALGNPSTGDDHVHFCVDGKSCDTEYQLAYGNSFQMTGLTPGVHTIEASLRHADHSSDGATDTITVTVTSAGSTTTSPAPAAPASGGVGATGSSGSGRYGY